MFSLIAPLIGLPATVAIHIVMWRMIRPRSPARLVPCAAILGGALGAWAAGMRLPWPATSELLEAILLFGTMVASYLISLPALESESPSSLIVTCVDDHGRAGATREDLAAVVNDETFVLDRLRGLEVDGLITRADGKLQITPGGKTFLEGFMAYHRLAGRRGLAG